MIALPRLKTDMPKEVFPSNWGEKTRAYIKSPIYFNKRHDALSVVLCLLGFSTYICEARRFLSIRGRQKFLILQSSIRIIKSREHIYDCQLMVSLLALKHCGHICCRQYLKSNAYFFCIIICMKTNVQFHANLQKNIPDCLSAISV